MAGGTAATDFLESRVARSVIVAEFRGQLGNDALVAAISFSETRTIHKRSNRAIKEGRDHSHVVFAKN